MTYEICNHAKIYKGLKNRIDPRVPIARHIAWQATTNSGTPSPWHVPEPNNYNYAVRGPRAYDCAFLQDQVFYREENSRRWWSVYYVTQDKIPQFEAWARQQSIDYLWFNSRAVPIRQNQRLLWNTKCAELNDSERLFQMGYYANLRSKYFIDDDTELLSIMGPVRDRVLDGLDFEDTGKFDEVES